MYFQHNLQVLTHPLYTLDVRQEAVFLRERLDVAPQALIRCLTVNGAAALGLAGYGRLEPGSRAVFSVLPESLSI